MFHFVTPQKYIEFLHNARDNIGRVIFHCSFSKKQELGLWIVRYISTALLFGLAFKAPGVFNRKSTFDSDDLPDVDVIPNISFTTMLLMVTKFSLEV